MAISKNKIRPYILVIADQFTLYSGSFTVTQTLIGNWSDFEAKELVAYIDKNFQNYCKSCARALADIQWVLMVH